MKSKKRHEANSVRLADKKGYPQHTKKGEENPLEYLPYNKMSTDPRIADWYGVDEREDNERINKNDPQRYKSKQQLAEELSGDLSENFKIGKRTKEKKAITAEKVKQTIEANPSFIKGEEYDCRILKIDDYGNATISIKGVKMQGMIYNARKIGLVSGIKKEVLFARTNKKGKFIFELPKSPQKILPDYYDTYAKGMSQENTLKKLFSLYGVNNVKKELKSEVNEIILEKVWEEYKKAA